MAGEDGIQLEPVEIFFTVFINACTENSERWIERMALSLNVWNSKLNKYYKFLKFEIKQILQIYIRVNSSLSIKIKLQRVCNFSEVQIKPIWVYNSLVLLTSYKRPGVLLQLLMYVEGFNSVCNFNENFIH